MPRVVVFDETGAPDVLHIVDEPVGEPAAGEVRIKIEAIGINRLDELLRAGTGPRPVRLPHARLGCEGTGIIDAVGADVEGLGVGDAVIVTALPTMDINGTYAEYTVVPANAVIPRPTGLDAATAAALWVSYSTAYGALIEKARMRPGDHVLITGASSSAGLAAIQVARQIGAIPLAVTRHSAKKAALSEAGAGAVIATDEDDLLKAVQQQAGPAGADIILDFVMGPGLAELAEAAAFNGTLVSAGYLDSRPAPFPMKAPLTMYRYMSFEHTLDPTVVRRIAAFLTAGLRTGALRPAVDRVFPLDDIVAVHRYMEQGQQRPGKIVVSV
ncbi:MAG TPA: zinc-dependent alcohol dehydrogenase family protein [Streptosporangiaceae bacterium]|nr:zinc-dependent alcohol dehydrogenase family protein [Streptosporangiaceae bacterium]